MFTSGIVVLPPLLIQKLHMSSGMARNLTSPISEFGDALHMSTFKRISGLGIRSHMEKCVFIGYPEGYKG